MGPTQPEQLVQGQLVQGQRALATIGVGSANYPLSMLVTYE